MTDDTNKRYGRVLTKRYRTHRQQFKSWLEQRQRPNQTLIKKGNSSIRHPVPMLASTAELLLAVYDEILLPSPAIHLQIALADISRNPRKGSPPSWPITDA